MTITRCLYAFCVAFSVAPPPLFHFPLSTIRTAQLNYATNSAPLYILLQLIALVAALVRE